MHFAHATFGTSGVLTTISGAVHDPSERTILSRID
jgi:hypothetical protein